MPNILGIDPSLTSTGIVILNNTQILFDEIINVKTYGIQRLMEIEERLSKYLVDYAPDLIALEGYAFARANQAHQMGELGGMIRMLLTRKGQKYIEIAPTQVKKFATGKGNAPKDIILQQVYKRWGVEFSDNNIADAFVLAKIGQAYLGDTKGLTKEQIEIVKKIKKNGNGGN